MSASFPYLSPAAPLPTLPRRRVVDAGYFDSYGVTLAAAGLLRHKEWVRRNVSGVMLIQIRDALSRGQRTMDDGGDADSSTLLSRGLEWLLSPPERALNARVWTNSLHNDEQLQILTEYFDSAVDDLYFTTVAFEFGGEVSLSWHLTREERRLIAEGARQVRHSLDLAELVAWWQGRPTGQTCGDPDCRAGRPSAGGGSGEEGGRLRREGSA
jgi:hypothetical protein